jgi:hypothetical protein
MNSIGNLFWHGSVVDPRAASGLSRLNGSATPTVAALSCIHQRVGVWNNTILLQKSVLNLNATQGNLVNLYYQMFFIIPY